MNINNFRGDLVDIPARDTYWHWKALNLQRLGREGQAWAAGRTVRGAHFLALASSDFVLIDLSVMSPHKILTFIVQKARIGAKYQLFIAVLVISFFRVNTEHSLPTQAWHHTTDVEFSCFACVGQWFCSQNQLYCFLGTLILYTLFWVFNINTFGGDLSDV